MNSTPAARRLGRVLSVALLVSAAVVPLAGPAEAAPRLVWERTLGGPVQESSPVIADLDGGGPDVVFGARDGQVWALHAGDGSDVGGWPRGTSNGISSSPSTADTDGDGRPEIFIGSGTAETTGGALYSFDHDGGQRFRFVARDNDFANPSIYSTPALGDVNGDGQADATFGSLGLQSIWSISQSGVTNAGFPFYSDDTVFSSAALTDVNGDGRTDFIIGADSMSGPPVDWSGGFVRAMTGGGQVLWEFRTNEIVQGSPAVGDIDGDGSPEVVFGTGDFYKRSDSTRLFVLSSSGQLKWSRETGAYTKASPTLADVDGDSRLEVIEGTWSGANPGQVWVWKGDGRELWHHSSGGGVVLGSITTADIDGDGGQDLLVPSGAGVWAFDGDTGAQMFALLEGQVGFQNSPLVTDVDGDGRLDVLLAGTKGGKGVAYRFELDGGNLGNLGWPMFRRDARRTGSWTESSLTSDPCPVHGQGGYWLAASDGGIFAFCDVAFQGSTGGIRLNQPIVAMAATRSGRGYWLAAADGGMFAFGDAGFHGSTGGIHLNQPIVGMARTPSGNGYWLAAADGGMFAFGDAAFHGSTGGMKLNQPIVAMASTPSGDGYWLAAADGGMFAFGDAAFHGSTGGMRLNQSIVGMARSRSGNGYLLCASDGGIFAFGDAEFHGSTGGIKLNRPIVDMAAVPSGRGVGAELGVPSTDGYWLVASDGGIFAFNAPFLGSTGGIKLNQPIVTMTAAGT
ncbi:MAG: FG-GAP-like repeat-containing protein [Actinomycetota bacterium]